MRLREYQNEAKRKIKAAFRKYNRVIFTQPTASGKSIIFCSVAYDYMSNGKAVLLIVNSRILLKQTEENLLKFGIEVNIIHGNNNYIDKKINVTTIQTLINRKMPRADMLIIDECHHTKAESYNKVWKKYPKAKILGITATPIRLDNKKLSDIYEYLVSGKNYSYLINNGFLSRIVLDFTPLGLHS